MLRVKTKLGISDIHGIGLFADELIPQGTRVWQFDGGLDQMFSIGQIEAYKTIEPKHIDFLMIYCWRGVGNYYFLCADDGRFINHSKTPNCMDDKDFNSVATRDIQKGEEITEDYSTWDMDFPKYAEKMNDTIS